MDNVTSKQHPLFVVRHFSCLFVQITILNICEMQFVVEEIVTNGVLSLNLGTLDEVLDEDQLHCEQRGSSVDNYSWFFIPTFLKRTVSIVPVVVVTVFVSTFKFSYAACFTL